LFIADNLRGKATVIAREGDSRYAFFRGGTWLGTPANAPAAPAEPAEPELPNQVDYQGNLFRLNDSIQQDNWGKFDRQRRELPNQGVKIQSAQ
jgi:hypothetical protein